jgi:hypothetical protein
MHEQKDFWHGSSQRFDDMVESLNSVESVETFATIDRPSSAPIHSARGGFDRRDSDTSISSEPPQYPLHLAALRAKTSRPLLRNVPARSSSRTGYVAGSYSSKGQNQPYSAFSVTTAATASLDTSPIDSSEPSMPTSVSAHEKRLPPTPLNILKIPSAGQVEELPLSPFRALLLREAEPYPVWLVDGAKLVTLNVGGSIFTASLKALYSKPSRLSGDFFFGYDSTSLTYSDRVRPTCRRGGKDPSRPLRL